MTGSDSLRKATRTARTNQVHHARAKLEGDAAVGHDAVGVAAQLMRCLTMRERLVVCLRYADGLSLDEVAIVLGAGPAEIERMLDEVTRRVRTIVDSVAIGPAKA